MTASATDAGQAGRTGVRSAAYRVLAWFDRRGFWTVFLGFLALGGAFSRIPVLEPFAWVCFALAGLLPLVFSTVDTDEEDDGFEYEMTDRERARYLGTALAWSVTPWGILTQLLQIGGHFAAMWRYRREYPSTDRHVPGTELSLPFDGEWTVVNGGVTEATSHSWGIVSQRYAYDFLVTDDDGDTHADDGTSLDDYYAFGEPIRAPADGTVVKTKDGLRDFPRPGHGWVEWRTWDIRGNHVVVKHADGEYSLLAHLKEGSVAVEPGDDVARGDVVGECGNSGHSGEPHLHYLLQDVENFWTAAGLVPRFADATVSRDDDMRDERDGYRPVGEDGSVDYLWAGDRVMER
ncbi:MAG: M23 family metallopeptidase [Halobacterium sp.]